MERAAHALGRVVREDHPLAVALAQRLEGGLLARTLCALGPIEAGLGAGFSDAAYFRRVFRRAYGVPPSRWREGSLRRAG